MPKMRDRGSTSAMYLSLDANQFKELKLEEGVWRHLTANEKGILSVYYASKHEKTILQQWRHARERLPAHGHVSDIFPGGATAFQRFHRTPMTSMHGKELN